MRIVTTTTLKRLALTCAAAVLLVGTTAWADSIGPTCGSGECLGNIYTLNYSQTSAQMGTDNYTITLTIDSSAFVDGTDSGFLMAVSPNINGWSNASLSSAPGGTSDWSAIMAGGLNSGGCDGHGTPFFCNDALSQGTFNEVGSSTPVGGAMWRSGKGESCVERRFRPAAKRDQGKRPCTLKRTNLSSRIAGCWSRLTA